MRRSPTRASISLLLFAVACGGGTGTPGATGTQPATTPATTPTITVASPTTRPAQDVTTGPTVAVPSPTSSNCEPPQQPALGAYGASDGSMRWMYCSTDETWRDLLGVTDDIVYVDSLPARMVVGDREPAATDRP